MDVQGFGRQKGHTEVYRGHEVTVNLLRKVQLQIAVNDEFVEPTINAIIKGGRTGKSGRDRRRQDLRPAARRLHPHSHRRTGRRSDLELRLPLSYLRVKAHGILSMGIFALLVQSISWGKHSPGFHWSALHSCYAGFTAGPLRLGIHLHSPTPAKYRPTSGISIISML